MFEIESKAPDEVTLKTKTANVKFDLVEQTVDGDLPVGKIEGPGSLRLVIWQFEGFRRAITRYMM